MSDMEALFGAPIHTYTREDALADGELVDVTHMARDAQFRIDVAMTRAAWVETVEWDDERPELQDDDGRLWDVLHMARTALHNKATSSDPSGDRVTYRVYRVPNENRGRGWNAPELIELTVHIGPGDEGEAVVTIMLPNES